VPNADDYAVRQILPVDALAVSTRQARCSLTRKMYQLRNVAAAQAVLSCILSQKTVILDLCDGDPNVEDLSEKPNFDALSLVREPQSVWGHRQALEGNQGSPQRCGYNLWRQG